MHSGMKALQDNVSQVSGYMEPLRNFTNGNPNCANDGICSLVLKAVEPMDAVVAATASLTASTTKFGAGAQGMQKSFSGAVDSVKNMRATVAQLGAITDQLTHAVGETRTMFSGLTEYLRAMREDFRSSGEEATTSRNARGRTRDSSARPASTSARTGAPPACWCSGTARCSAPMGHIARRRSCSR